MRRRGSRRRSGNAGVRRPARNQKKKPAADPFSREELRAFFDRNIKQIASAAEKRKSTQSDVANRLTEFANSLTSIQALLDAPGSLELEDLERRLTILDEKVQASLTQFATEDQMLRIRREVDSQLTQYRRKMKAEQIALVERQYIQKRLLEEFGLPRLSLYYFS